MAEVAKGDVILYDHLPCLVLEVLNEPKFRKHITALDIRPVGWGERDPKIRVFLRTDSIEVVGREDG
jgi:hypothetical protein